MKASHITSQSFFEAKYRAAEDPWDFATSAYERQRYQAILDALAPHKYQHAFEPGCSVGVLTEKLATICAHVDAMDISPSAVVRAKARTQHLPNVQTTCGTLPDFIPSGTFDLIIFSEIGYYFPEDSLMSLAANLVSRTSTPGTFLAAHWLGESPDHLLSGDCVHEVLARIPELELQHTERHESFRLDVFARR